MTSAYYLHLLAKRDQQAQLVPPIPVRQQIPPVADQLRSLLARVPPALADQPMSLDALRAQLVGRFNRPPQRGEVAHALTLLGFRQKRIYRKGYDSRHFWIRIPQPL
jgi:hypothetical protein